MYMKNYWLKKIINNHNENLDTTRTICFRSLGKKNVFIVQKEMFKRFRLQKTYRQLN